MLVGTQQVMCIEKKEPRDWEFNGQSGTTYKVGLSDGTSKVELKCRDAETWAAFVPFQYFYATIEIWQTIGEKGLITKCQVTDAKPAKQ